MDKMKGVGRALLSCRKGNGTLVDLLRFADGSVSMRVQGRCVGVWEWAEREEGVVAFFAFTGFDHPTGPGEPPDLIVLRVKSSKHAQSMN